MKSWMTNSLALPARKTTSVPRDALFVLRSQIQSRQWSLTSWNDSFRNQQEFAHPYWFERLPAFFSDLQQVTIEGWLDQGKETIVQTSHDWQIDLRGRKAFPFSLSLSCSMFNGPPAEWWHVSLDSLSACTRRVQRNRPVPIRDAAGGNISPRTAIFVLMLVMFTFFDPREIVRRQPLDCSHRWLHKIESTLSWAYAIVMHKWVSTELHINRHSSDSRFYPAQELEFFVRWWTIKVLCLF